MAKNKPKPAVAVAAAETLASGELSQSLDQLQYEANSWAESVERHAYRVVEAGIECGRRLVAIKARLGHGTWNHWVGQFFDYDTRTAQRYMSLAQYAGEIANQPTITRALAVIADIREEERAAEGKASRRKPEPAAAREKQAQKAFDRTYSAEALGRHIDAADPDEEEEIERDEQPRPTMRQVSEASRKPEQPEPVKIRAPQLLPEADECEPEILAPELIIEGTLHMFRGPVDFAAEVDRLYWIGLDGIEQENDPLQLLEYVRNLVSEEMPERRAAVVAALRAVADEIEED